MQLQQHPTLGTASTLNNGPKPLYPQIFSATWPCARKLNSSQANCIVRNGKALDRTG